MNIITYYARFSLIALCTLTYSAQEQKQRPNDTEELLMKAILTRSFPLLTEKTKDIAEILLCAFSIETLKIELTLLQF